MMKQKIAKFLKHVQFSTIFCQKHNSIYILVTTDTSTNYALLICCTEYQEGWSKCLNISCVLIVLGPVVQNLTKLVANVMLKF